MALMVKRSVSVAAIVFFLSAMVCVSQGQAQSLSIDPTQDQDKDAAETQEEWNKDIDKKLDTAIDVLGIIKDELKEEDKDQAAVSDSTGADAEEAMAANLARWIGKINRVWKKITMVTAQEDGATPAQQDAAVDADKEVIDTKAISSKIGTAMEMMAAIKKELDKEQKEEMEAK